MKNIFAVCVLAAALVTAAAGDEDEVNVYWHESTPDVVIGEDSEDISENNEIYEEVKNSEVKQDEGDPSQEIRDKAADEKDEVRSGIEFFPAVNGIFVTPEGPVPAENGDEISLMVKSDGITDIIYVLVNGSLGDYFFDGEKCVVKDDRFIDGNNIVSLKVMCDNGRIICSPDIEIIYGREDIVL